MKTERAGAMPESGSSALMYRDLRTAGKFESPLVGQERLNIILSVGAPRYL